MARKRPSDVGTLFTHLSAADAGLFVELLGRVHESGRIGPFSRSLLMRVAVYSAAKGVGLAEAFDAVTGVGDAAA